MPTPLKASLVSRDLPIDELFLDPNNPRFVGSGFVLVPDDQVCEVLFQQQARTKLVRDFGIDRLRINMSENGYLPIDRVIVRKVGENKYVVLEGNRRICAAKILRESAAEEHLDPEIVATTDSIPCLEYTGDNPRAAWIFQGLRHITGYVDWSSFNKAKLLTEQMEADGLTLTEVGRKFGLSGQGAGQWMRGYRAFLQAADHPDFNGVLTEQAYPFFMELFSRSSGHVREWLGWSDQDSIFTNELNFEEFLGWIYPSPPKEEVPEGVVPQRDWSLRRLTTRDELRNVSYLIHEAPGYFERFRQDPDIDRWYAEARAEKILESQEDVESVYESLISLLQKCAARLERVPYRIMQDAEKREALKSEVSELIVQAQELGLLRDQVDGEQ